MEKLPDSVLLRILSLLDDSAEVARCRVASKGFNTVFPNTRSINLLEWVRRYMDSTSRVPDSSNSQDIKPFKPVFLDLISKLETVESVCISLELLILNHLGPFLQEEYDLLTVNKLGHYIEGEFFKEWLPRVSESLKSLSIDGHPEYHIQCRSYIWSIVSAYCHNLVNLKMKYAMLSVYKLKPMPMLTSLTLEFIQLETKDLHVLNTCFPNLQDLKMELVTGLEDVKINLPNLKTCHYIEYLDNLPLTLITPNLVTLRVKRLAPVVIRVEAPVLSNFHLSILSRSDTNAFNPQAIIHPKFENLKTLWIESSCILILLSELPITKSVENLTVVSSNKKPREPSLTKFSLTIMFSVFRNVSSLCIKSNAWSELETGTRPECLKKLNRGIRLKTLCAYLMLVDPMLTFSYVASVLDQCGGLLNVSFLIHGDVDSNVSECFKSKCMTRWPRLKWRWGIWNEDKEDSWITNGSSVENRKSAKRIHM